MFAAIVREHFHAWVDFRRVEPDGNPTVTLDDVMDYNELLLIDGHNQRQAQKAAAKAAKNKGKPGRRSR